MTNKTKSRLAWVFAAVGVAFPLVLWIDEAGAQTPSTACEIIPGGFIECVVPAAEMPFLVPLTSNCRVLAQDDYAVTIRCTTGEVVEPKIVAGPTPVVKLPAKVKAKPTKKVKKHHKKRKKKR